MTNKWSPKDSSDKRDYWFDFQPLGLADDETLTAATVTIAAGQYEVTGPYADLTLDTHSIVNNTEVVIRVEGGVPAAGTSSQKYAIQYHVTTSTGQEFDLTKTLEVKERTA